MAIDHSCAATQDSCVRNTPPSLDDFDHRLLALLQRDATATLAELGDAIGLSASAVQRRISRYRRHGLLRQVAVIDPAALPGTTLAAVLVTMERDTLRIHGAFRARMRAAAERDYLVLLVASSVTHYREVAERLFVDEGNVKRYETRMVFDVVKHGLELPTGPAVKKKRARR